MDALSEMQQKLEGVGSGVRAALEARRQGRLGAIRGMLGDFIRTDSSKAPVVEAALAGADQQLLVDTLGDARAVAAELNEIIDRSGAVELLCLDSLGTFSQDFSAGDCPHVLGRVIDWVTFEARLAPAMWRLLGRTLVVRSLEDACAAAAETPGGFRFVTLSGELLEPDGRVRIGAANKAAGVISRRSELVELESRRQQLDGRIADLQRRDVKYDEELDHLDEMQQKLRTVIYEANTERVEWRSRLARRNEELEKLERERPVITADLESIAAEIDQSVRAEHEAKEKAAELERANARRQGEIETLGEQIAAAERRREELAQNMTELKVALGRAEEKTRSLRDALVSLERQGEQMSQDLAAGRSEIELSRRRRQEAESGAGAARRQVDLLYARQKELNAEADELEETRRGLDKRLEEIRTELSAQRKAHEAAANDVNSRKVALGEADVRIENLITRASEEMGMNLLELYESYEHDDSRDWDAVEAEIKELRAKIQRLGNVNLDAIAEQDELEKRREFLDTQLADVKTSRDQLDELIRRINRRSTKLFNETFQAVRENFQQLFRKLFGGGRADIFLTNPEDVLESGIEIVARPPGKELRSLSLLSGGEKTMTALALLFSIFRAKPSPFCLLDEVDAALDETNTQRFARLLQEFNDNSQFIIISHAKRTMSMAGVLYGVTMQEAGVSKRISVRFEDVGHKMDAELEPVGA